MLKSSNIPWKGLVTLVVLSLLLAATVAAATGSSSATPSATAVGTSGTLAKTGGSDDGAATLGFLVFAFGALLLLSAFGLAVSRYP